MKMTWLTGMAGAAAVSFVLALAPQSASAITLGENGTCHTGFNAVGVPDGHLLGTTQFGQQRACEVGGSIDNTISGAVLAGLGGGRDNLANWSVMSTPYGVFDLGLFGPGVSKAVFQSLIAANDHDFGWADTADPNNLTVILPNTQGANPGDTVEFQPTADPFLFFARNAPTVNDQPNLLFFSDPSENANNFNHFLILEGTFGGGREYLLFIEDLNTNLDNDHNDAVVLIQAPIPEPTTLALLGVGVLGLGLAYRRRRAG